jgi:putative endonuclease
MPDKTMTVYIMTNIVNTVLYIGVTNNLERRVYEHKHGLMKGFTKKYKVNKLVYFESTSNPMAAIHREKQLKNWHRIWKLNLIMQQNPTFNDLSVVLFGDAETSSA